MDCYCDRGGAHRRSIQQDSISVVWGFVCTLRKTYILFSKYIQLVYIHRDINSELDPVWGGAEPESGIRGVQPSRTPAPRGESGS